MTTRWMTTPLSLSSASALRLRQCGSRSASRIRSCKLHLVPDNKILLLFHQSNPTLRSNLAFGSSLLPLPLVIPSSNRINFSTVATDGPPSFRKTGAGYGNVRDRVFPTEYAERDTLFRHITVPHTCTIVGAPMTYGQPYVGTDSGPTLLREAGLRSMLSSLGWRVEDGKSFDLDFDNTLAVASVAASAVAAAAVSSTNVTPAAPVNAKNSRIVGKATEQLANVVQSIIKRGRFPLVLGGDHSIAIGTLSGILRERPNTGILWIDAHADLNTPAISESGNMHGMPVGMLMAGVSPTNMENIPGFSWLQDGPRLQPDQIVYVGLRDVDPAERSLIQSLHIPAYTMHEIDRYGIGRVMEMALEHLLHDHPDRPIHLSYDIDAIDPILAPATGTAVRGGLNFREAHFVAEAVAKCGNLASAEIVELNPTLSHEEGAKETVDLGLQIITSFMGKSII